MTALPPDDPHPAERLLHARALEPDAPAPAEAIYRALSGLDDARRGLARLFLRKGQYRAAQRFPRSAPYHRLLPTASWRAIAHPAGRAAPGHRPLPYPPPTERGVHIALALLITGKDTAEARQPLQEALRTIKGDGSARAGAGAALPDPVFTGLPQRSAQRPPGPLRLLWQEDTAGLPLPWAPWRRSART